jgi:hypothetical protein
MATHWKKLQNPDYLGAYSLANDKGTYSERVVKITAISKQIVTGANNKSDECIIARFANEPKPMILNATNCKQLVKLSKSDFIEHWIGLSVTLYVSKVKAFGEVMDALRIKAARQDVAPHPAAPAAPVSMPELTPAHASWESARQAVQDGKTTIEQIRTKYILTEENATILVTPTE